MIKVWVLVSVVYHGSMGVALPPLYYETWAACTAAGEQLKHTGRLVFARCYNGILPGSHDDTTRMER